jgi:hypothetical protein
MSFVSIPVKPCGRTGSGSVAVTPHEHKAAPVTLLWPLYTTRHEYGIGRRVILLSSFVRQKNSECAAQKAPIESQGDCRDSEGE